MIDLLPGVRRMMAHRMMEVFAGLRADGAVGPIIYHPNLGLQIPCWFDRDDNPLTPHNDP